MNKENLKTILIVGLFIISITLTQQLWIVLPLGEAVSTSNDYRSEENKIEISDILSPQSFIINFGGGNHTVFFTEPYEVWNISRSDEKDSLWIWKNVRTDLEKYFTGNIEFEVITEEEWKSINKFKSLRLDFACEIPGSSLIEILSKGKKIVDHNLKDIDSMVLPASGIEKNNIYLGNLKENFYLKIKGINSNENIATLIDNISKRGESKGYVSYYRLKDYIDVENDVLTPIFEDVDIPEIKTMNEVDVTDKTLVRSLANKFFGESMDFVKEIKETNGTIIYMYGYGEKALKINADGLLENIEQLNKQVTSENPDFVTSLKVAGSFVKEYIGWPINSENAYLSSYQMVGKDKNKGYRFSFGYRLKGLPVVIPNTGQNGAIEVEVIGNQVTYYKRIIKKIENEQVTNKEIPLFLTILDRNLKRLKSDYTNNKGLEREIESTTILEYIRSIELAYFYDDDRSTLIPSWKVLLDDMTYYFDLYEGNLLHSYRLN